MDNIVLKKKALTMLSIIILLFSACADVPENVKNKKQGQEDKVELGSRVTVDRLLEGAEDVSAYIKEKGYEGKFVLDSDVHIELPEKLYELETETVSEAYRHYPEIYSELFGRDFWEDSGAKDFSELPRYSEHINEPGYYFIDITSAGDGVIYSEGGTDSSDLLKRLTLTSGGFLFYSHDTHIVTGEINEMIKAGGREIPDKKIRMADEKDHTLGELTSAANEQLNSIYGKITDSYEFRVGKLCPYYDNDICSALYIEVEKCYKGVPFCNQLISEYAEEGRRQYAPVYTAMIDETQKITGLESPFGIDKVISEKELSDGLVSLAEAFDIMNNELAPKIKLNISEIRLCYMCDYDSADVDAALSANRESLTREQSTAAFDPTLTPGRKYRAYPVWEFIMDKNIPDSKGNYRMKEICDIITVDAQTGKLTNYIDKVSQR